MASSSMYFGKGAVVRAFFVSIRAGFAERQEFLAVLNLVA